MASKDFLIDLKIGIYRFKIVLVVPMVVLLELGIVLDLLARNSVGIRCCILMFMAVLPTGVRGKYLELQFRLVL